MDGKISTPHQNIIGKHHRHFVQLVFDSQQFAFREIQTTAKNIVGLRMQK